VPGSFFAVALFHADDPHARAVAHRETARFYPADGSVRNFGARLWIGGGADAVCLMASANRRLACADVVALRGERVTFRPLATDDRRVAKEVWYDRPEGGQQPGCATCF
jgi:hypothetical protein